MDSPSFDPRGLVLDCGLALDSKLVECGNCEYFLVPSRNDIVNEQDELADCDFYVMFPKLITSYRRSIECGVDPFNVYDDRSMFSKHDPMKYRHLRSLERKSSLIQMQSNIFSHLDGNKFSLIVDERLDCFNQIDKIMIDEIVLGGISLCDGLISHEILKQMMDTNYKSQLLGMCNPDCNLVYEPVVKNQRIEFSFSTCETTEYYSDDLSSVAITSYGGVTMKTTSGKKVVETKIETFEELQKILATARQIRFNLRISEFFVAKTLDDAGNRKCWFNVVCDEIYVVQ